ncbi:MAG: bifunctional riboflavin kinase/FAD synthetase [Spirochaetales bacterium]|nr:bifunctional riboflavin kinase/FAD synthetase [Spirochaetales bacterium]
MQIVHDIDSFRPDWSESVVTPGVFDGLHRGHQALIQRLQKHSRRGGARVLVTYEPHPDQVLGKSRGPFSECFTYLEKLSLFQQFDLDAVVFLRFTPELAKMTALRYLKEILLGRLRARTIIIGYDQCFGRSRKGDYSFLKMMSKRYSYRVERIAAVQKKGRVISTTEIKSALRAGQIELANEWLGHPFFLTGTVVRGFGRGERLGFPTANLELPETKLVPGAGVYAAMAEWGQARYPCMLNIGYAPTFGGKRLSVEAHLLDFSAALYGEQLRLHMLERVRSEIAFSSVEDLKAQLERDRAEIRRIIRLRVQGRAWPRLFSWKKS